MKNRIQNILVFFLLIAVVVLGIYTFLIIMRMDNSNGVNRKPCVPDANTAVSIAQVVCKSYTDIDVEAEAFFAEYNEKNGIWKVSLKSDGDFMDDNANILHRGHAIYIEREDATVIEVSITADDIKNRRY